MSEEKILKDENLKDEELEEVVGGYLDSWHDYQNIKKLEAKGYGNFYGQNPYETKGKDKFHYLNLEAAFREIGKTLGLNISAVLFYDGTPGKSPNGYFLEGKEIPRNELWSIINEGFAAKK